MVAFVILFAQLGGLLNRGRGGYINFGEIVDYWPAHILSRLLFAVPTGLVVVSSIQLVILCFLKLDPAGKFIVWRFFLIV